MPDFRSLVHVPLLVPSPLQRYRPNPGRHTVHDNFVLTSTGRPGTDCNSVIVFGPEPSERVFALADAFFDVTEYAVGIEVDAAQPMEDAVRALGWHLDEEEPALVLSPIPTPPLAPPDLTIRLVTTEADFADFMTISKTAYRWIPSLAAASDPAVALFVGYDGATPVAASRLTCYRAVGDINGVVTLPAYRRQGFGTAMTWAAIAEGTRRGCTAMTLNATKMGYPVYVQMGFVPVCTYRTYLPPEPGG